MTLADCDECGLPLELLETMFARSTDGVIRHARARCINGHQYVGPYDNYEWTEGET